MLMKKIKNKKYKNSLSLESTPDESKSNTFLGRIRDPTK